MALKNLFDMAKADKYTADGREALIKAQEAETEDKVYQIGEISQKTGLQKTANGWVKPKKGAAPAKKENPTRTFEFKAGPDGNPVAGSGKEVKTYKTKKEAEAALKKQNAAAEEPSPDRDDSPEREAYERELSRQQAQRAADDPRGFGYEEPPMEPAAAPKLNQVEKVDNTNRPYRIKGTQFYFETPEEAETAIVAGTRGEGKTYAKASKDPEINNIQEALGFKLDMLGSGKSMDKFMKKIGENEYAANVWAFGTDSKGTLINPLDETDKPNSVIKKENGEWKLHYTGRDGRKIIVSATGREHPTSDAAPSLSEIVDRVYNIGEISEKTGLQKTANGWRPVKKGAAGKTSRANKEEAIRKDLGLTAGEDMSRFSDEQIESMYQKTQKTPEQQKADFDKSKIGQAVNKGRQEFAAEKTRQKELASKTNAIGLPKENNLSDIPDFKGMESGDYDKKLRAEGWTTGGWEGNGTHASAIFKKGDRTIRVNEGQPGKITSVQEISKPAVEKFDIEKWKTGPKVEKNSKLDWSHGVVGETIPVQGKSAEEKRNLINKYNSVGRLSRIGTKKNSYYNNKHGTFEVAGIDNDNVYIQEERSNGMGSRYMALVTIPLNEVEEINPFHDYGKRNPDTGEESPTRPPLPEDAAPRVLTGDTRIRVRKEKAALTGDTRIKVRK